MDECTMDLQDVPAIQIKREEMAETPRTMQKRRRVRRLVVGDVYTPPQSSLKAYLQRNKTRLFCRALFVTFIIVLVWANLCTKKDCFVGTAVIENFINSYHRHYHEIVHGTVDYCDPDLDVKTIFNSIRREDILHQERPLGLLQLAMRNNSNLNAIALVGASGVGKTMIARALATNFPWLENVHTYSWNTYVPDESHKFAILRLMVNSFSECGRNLLIVDNLAPCDREVVSIVNKLVRQAENAELKHATVIYIIQLNAMDHVAVYKKQFEVMQDLPTTTVINLNMFGIEELKDCIHREARIENLALSKKSLDEIVRSIDPRRSGCKNVRAKVLMYGK